MASGMCQARSSGAFHLDSEFEASVGLMKPAHHKQNNTTKQHNLKDFVFSIIFSVPLSPQHTFFLYFWTIQLPKDLLISHKHEAPTQYVFKSCTCFKKDCLTSLQGCLVYLASHLPSRSSRILRLCNGSAVVRQLCKLKVLNHFQFQIPPGLNRDNERPSSQGKRSLHEIRDCVYEMSERVQACNQLE